VEGCSPERLTLARWNGGHVQVVDTQIRSGLSTQWSERKSQAPKFTNLSSLIASGGSIPHLLLYILRYVPSQGCRSLHEGERVTRSSSVMSTP
jgi:hypothetical protein